MSEKKSKHGFGLKNIVIYLLTLLLAGVPALFMNTVFGWLPFLMLFFTGLLSLLYALLCRNAVMFEVKGDVIDCVRGDQVNFDVRLKNKSMLLIPHIEVSLFRSDLFGNVIASERQSFMLAPHEECSFGFTAAFDHVGIYTAGLEKITVFDFFGLISFTQMNKHHLSLRVSPQVCGVGKVSFAKDAKNESSKSVVNSPVEGMDYSGIREYRFGDPIKNIHWKLSAHSREYMTKQRETQSNTGVSIITDFSMPEMSDLLCMSTFDAITESAISLAHSCANSGIDYEIIYKDIYEQSKHFVPQEFLHSGEWIAQIAADKNPDEKKSNILDEYSRSGSAYSNLIYCAASFSDAAAEKLVRLARNGKHVQLIFVLPADFAQEQKHRSMSAVFKKLDTAQIPYYVISQAKELQ